MIGITQQASIAIDEPVVHAPPVDAHAGERGRQPSGPPQAFDDVVVQPQHVPMQPVGQRDRIVGDPAGLLELERVRADVADDDVPGRRAEVDGGDGVGHR